MKKYPLLCSNSPIPCRVLELLRSDGIYFFPFDLMETLLPMIPVHNVFLKRQTKGDNKVTYKFPEKFYKSFMTDKPSIAKN